MSELESKQDIEQYTSKFNLEIHGFPENEDEDLANSVIRIDELTGVIVTRKDIDIVHRMKKKSRNLPDLLLYDTEATALRAYYTVYGVTSKITISAQWVQRAYSLMET